MAKTILIINKFCPLHPKAGGAEKNLAEIFSRIGAHNRVFLLAAMFPGAQREEIYRNINIIRIGSPRSENVIRIHLLLPLVLKGYLQTLKPDVLFEDVSVIPLFTPLFYPKQNKAVMIHNFNGVHAFSSQRPFFALISVIAEAFFRVLYKKETVVVVSEWMREELLGNGFSNVYKVLNGIDKNLLNINKEYARRPTVLFLGRLEGRKGTDLLLKTYPLVKRAIGDVQYVIAGREFSFGSNRTRSILKCYRREYSPREISFPGFVSEEQKRELLKTAWLFVAPSRIEGYSITVLEANATGTFIIANDVPGLKESVKNGETGLLVDCYDTSRFAAAITEWLSIKKLSEKERACRAWARTHDWDESARQMEGIIFS
ncbi:MAG: glycosyltransferase family 4 protein [Minisyncoccia bacterium]|jgi:glycosyltransferase involved in cell wall biosynthesis